MQLLDMLFRRNARRQMASLVAEVARLSLPYAAAELGGRLTQMSLAESRGYIRAQVRLTVEDQAATLLTARQPVSNGKMQSVVVERALDRVVTRLVAEQARWKFAPAIELRRAA